MRQSYFPSQQNALGDWARRFAQGVFAKAAELGVPEPLAEEVLARQQALATALLMVRSDATRTRLAVSIKDQAVARFKEAAREAAEIIKARRDLEDSVLLGLGLKVPARARQHIAAPAVGPDVFVLGVERNVVRLALGSGEAKHKSRPRGCVAAVLHAAISEHVPTEASQWHLRQMVSRARCKIEFPVGLPAGTCVWISARWLTRRAETSPPGSIASAHLGHSTELPGIAA